MKTQKINCLSFKINDRFDLSISDVGKGRAWQEVVIFDNEKEEFVGNWGKFAIVTLEELESVIKQAKEECNNIITKEIFEANEHLLIK